MKATLLFILIILIYSCASTNNETITSIIQLQNDNLPSTNADAHFDKDVEFFRNEAANSDHMAYTCTLYIMNNEKLAGYSSHIVVLNTYDKAAYKWINDSTITFKMYNKYHNSKNYTMMGYGEGRTTSLSVDD